MNSNRSNTLNIIAEITDKRFSELTNHWKKIVNTIFPEVRDEDVLYASLINSMKEKSNVRIDLNNRHVLINVRFGKNVSFHFESFYDFLRFLRVYKTDQRVIKILSFYQFGKSDKLNTSFSREEIVKEYGSYIKEFNDYFLSHSEVIKSLVNRVFFGSGKNKKADYFYFGSSKRGFIYNPYDLFKEIVEDRNESFSSPHFFSLIYDVTSRSRSLKDDCVRIRCPYLINKFNNWMNGV